MLSEIGEFLNRDNLTAKDVIITAFISSFLFWVLTGFLKKLGDLLKKLGIQIFKKLKVGFRKYLKQSINVNEYIEIENRLRQGGSLKWYEKKGYNKMQESSKKMRGEMGNNKVATQEWRD